jgi:soluble lytic murein transglycosylase-like protein
MRVARAVIGVTIALAMIATPAMAKHAAAQSHKAAHHMASAKKIALTPYQTEQAMGPAQLVERWKLFTDQAARRIGLPAVWIKAVMIEESGGRTMLAENTPIVSSAGAMGLMQLMPDTWREMRQIYNLGIDPNDPHDNIMAGAAYLRALYWEYGYPGMFAAYNDGPQNIEAHRRASEMLPQETSKYIVDIAAILQRAAAKGAKVAPPASLPSFASAEPDVTVVTAEYPKDNDDDYDGDE